MAPELYTLKAFHPEHGLRDVTLTVSEVGDDFQISCPLPLTDVVLIGFSDDCFEALLDLRRQAERRQWSICCKGARRNVWPSGMSRDMGGGVRAYTVEMRRPARMDSLVDIFDEDTPEMYCSVADQEAFAEAWFQSLRTR